MTESELPYRAGAVQIKLDPAPTWGVIRGCGNEDSVIQIASRAMDRARKAVPDVLAAGAVALGIWLFFGHAFLNYDTFYALLWGDDLVGGRTPQYEVPVAPTPHPLATAAGALASLFGDSGEDVLLAAGLLSMGALAVGLFRLGQELYVWPVGLLAAAIFMTRVPILNFGVRGYVDLPTVALIVWAAVLEARRRRRGTPVLVLLTLAGLLRPEAWLFAAAYLAWLWPVRPRLIALAAAAPLIWMASDLLVTGNPLWSLTGTQDLAAELNRRTGVDDLLSVAPRRLGEILRLPELIAAVGGLAAGLAWMRERTLLPLAIAALNGLTFCAFAVLELPLLGRYLFLAAAMIALFAALGALGWTALPPEHRATKGWRAGGLVALAAIVLFFPLQQVDRLDNLRDDIAARDRIQADLKALVRSAEWGVALERCGRVSVVGHRSVPEIAYWTGLRPEEIDTSGGAEGSLVVVPATPEVAELSVLDPNEPGETLQTPDAPVAARNRSWRALENRC